MNTPTRVHNDLSRLAKWLTWCWRKMKISKLNMLDKCNNLQLNVVLQFNSRKRLRKNFTVLTSQVWDSTNMNHKVKKNLVFIYLEKNSVVLQNQL